MLQLVPVRALTALLFTSLLFADEMQTVRDLHERIQAHAADKRSDYSITIPNTTVSYSMAAILAGDFLMGSPDSDPQRKPDEQPRHKVHVDKFWMQIHEVTWDEYRLFMFANQAGEPARRRGILRLWRRLLCRHVPRR